MHVWLICKHLHVYSLNISPPVLTMCYFSLSLSPSLFLSFSPSLFLFPPASLFSLLFLPLSLQPPPSISRVTSWNRVTPLTASAQPGSSAPSAQPDAPETDDLHVIGLIPHLNLDAARLQQILQGLYSRGTFLVLRHLTWLYIYIIYTCIATCICIHVASCYSMGIVAKMA